jgi:hypothetical protein
MGSSLLYISTKRDSLSHTTYSLNGLMKRIRDSMNSPKNSGSNEVITYYGGRDIPDQIKGGKYKIVCKF